MKDILPLYLGITAEICNISNHVKDKDILLIDDVYTRSINIDEDAIQVLLDKGARSVTFYAIGCTGITNFSQVKKHDLFRKFNQYFNCNDL